MKHLLIAIVVPALVASTGGGCGSPGARDDGSGGGAMTRAVEAPPLEAHGATLEAMRALGLSPVERGRDGFRDEIAGEIPASAGSPAREVRAFLTRMTDRTTKVEVRIEGPRDEGRLKGILDEIEVRIRLR